MAAIKIYMSSTYKDLREHRAAVDIALRRMGHDVIGMEQYVAEGTAPLEKCLQDVRSSDAYMVIVGWRYGFRPRDTELNPYSRSITELEYRAAVDSGKSEVISTRRGTAVAATRTIRMIWTVHDGRGVPRWAVLTTSTDRPEDPS